MNRSLGVWIANLLLGGFVAFAVVYIGLVPIGVALIAGGLAEALGFGMTFWDLMETERQVRRFLHGPRDITIRPAPIRLRTRMGTPTVTVGPPPPLEERVASLERAFGSIEERIQDAADKAREEAEEAARHAANAARADAEDDARRLDDLISGMTLGGMQLRRLGVFFFVVGLALATAANLVAS